LVLDLIILILRRLVNLRFKIRPIHKKIVKNINFTKATCILKRSFSLWGKGERTKNGEEMAYMFAKI